MTHAFVSDESFNSVSDSVQMAAFTIVRRVLQKNITIGKSLQEAIKTSTLYYFERGKRSRTLFIDDLSATTFVVLVPAISLSNNHTVFSHHLSDLLVGG